MGNLRDIEKDPENRQIQEELAERCRILGERMTPEDQALVKQETERVREAVKAYKETKKKLTAPVKRTRGRKPNSHDGAAA